MMASNQLFDLYIAQSQSRSRSSSSNSSMLSGALSPPPRAKKPGSPPAARLDSAASSPLANPRPIDAPKLNSVFADASNSRSSSPFVNGDASQRSVAVPSGQRAAHHGSDYSGSISSLTTYSNLFYDAREHASPSPQPPSDTMRESPLVDFDDDVSISDYSDLLYPELQSTATPQPSPRLSLDVHGPLPRRRVSSFNSQEGPESPVEFATIGGTSPIMPTSLDAETNPLQSRVEELFGDDTQSQLHRNVKTKKLAFEEGRRESFIDFGTPANASVEAAIRNKPSLADEMPVFNARRAAQSQGRSIGEYKTLMKEVEGRRTDYDLESLAESRQVYVDGSDKRKPATPEPGNSLPATSNTLDPQERADRLKQNRKIVQVLGPTAMPATQTPPRAVSASPHRFTRSDSLPTESLNAQNLRENRLQGDKERSTHALASKSSWSALDQTTIFLHANGRRHSSPLSPSLHAPEYYSRKDPDNASLSSLGSIIEPTDDKQAHTPRSGSPTSFIDLSDDDGMKTPKRRRSVERVIVSDIESQDDHLGSGASASVHADSSGMGPLQAKNHFVSSSLSDDEGHRADQQWKGEPQGEEWQRERQRKRQQLAKIHRYLGSKVPAELVIGFSSATAEEMIASPVPERPRTTDDVPVESVKELQKRRRSSSGAQVNPWEHRRPEPVRTMTDTLSSSEKRAIIKRAQKIEQIFGEQPTRPLSISRAPATVDGQFTRQEKAPAPIKPIIDYPVVNPRENGYKARSPFPKKDGRPSTAGSSRPSTAQSTTGLLSSYSKDVERERKARQKPIVVQVDQTRTVDALPSPFPIGTALGSPLEDMYDDVLDISATNLLVQPSKAAVLPGITTSRQFLNYRTSLNSLGRMLDQDDRQSLNELHAVLDNSEDEDGAENVLHTNPHHRRPQPTLTHDTVDPRLQRTIQYRASLASINTVDSTSTYATLTPEPMTFQARRKRAAKLAHFFGATYRDLFGEVLDRIERGMLEEATRGEMSQDELKHLVKQLDKLKRRHSQLD